VKQARFVREAEAAGPHGGYAVETNGFRASPS
jgi:hypothetical protein